MIVIKTNINNCAGIILETHVGVKNNNNNVVDSYNIDIYTIK